MRISDWSSDVCSSDLSGSGLVVHDLDLDVDLLAVDRQAAVVVDDVLGELDAGLPGRTDLCGRSRQRQDCGDTQLTALIPRVRCTRRQAQEQGQDGQAQT